MKPIRCILDKFFPPKPVESCIAVFLRELSTGKTKVYYSVGSFENGKFGDFLWSRGNYACDCNRSILGDFPNHDCGDYRIMIDKIIRISDPYKILYTERREDD